MFRLPSGPQNHFFSKWLSSAEKKVAGTPWDEPNSKDKEGMTDMQTVTRFCSLQGLCIFSR